MVSAWVPEGMGELNRTLLWLVPIYLALYLGIYVATFVFDWSAWAYFATIPLVVVYFFVVLFGQWRVTRRIRSLQGRVCYQCGYEIDVKVGDVCTECGHVQTKKNRQLIERIAIDWGNGR